MRYILFFLLVFGQIIKAQISPDLSRKMVLNELTPVLIELKQQADLSGVQESWTKEQKANYVYTTLKSHAELTQNALVNYLENHHIEYRAFYLVNAIWAKVNQAQILEIAQFPEIRRVSFDSYSHAVPTQDNTLLLSKRSPEVTWGILRVGADKVWAKGFEGQGVVVAGNDTGIKWDIPAIKDRYRGFSHDTVNHNYNWHDAIHHNSPLSSPDNNPCGLDVKEPCDDNSHGTHTVGTMVGLTSDHAIGMAPKAQFIGCRNMERGNGAPSTYIECFEFFLAPYNLDGKNAKPELAPHVINDSWYCSLEEGCDTSTFPIMEVVVENLRAAGIVVVVSAGNDGASCNTLNHIPALYKNSFSVGAFAPNEMISSFSSCGPVNNYKSVITKPNVVAPGSDVLSMLPDGSYASWNGTSMAGPHVAGLVALMISANPVLAGHVEQIETIIEETAERFHPDFDCFPFSGMSVPNNVYGFGLINADKAVERALLAVRTENAKGKDEFRIYPNPSKNEIHIDRPSAEPVLISIKDVFGKTWIHLAMNGKSNTINISGLNSGVYFISNENTKKTYSLIKL